MAVIGPEHDLVCRRTLAVLGEQRLEHRDHVDVAVEMIGLEERQAVAFALGRAQMGKADPRREAFGHRGQIVFRAHAERAGAEADAVGLRGHGIEQRLIVFRRGCNARQAEQRPRRVVRMQRQRHAEGFGDRRHAREEFAEVLAQHRGIDAAILLQAVAELRDRQRIGGGARQRAGNVGDEDVDIGLRHP